MSNTVAPSASVVPSASVTPSHRRERESSPQPMRSSHQTLYGQSTPPPTPLFEGSPERKRRRLSVLSAVPEGGKSTRRNKNKRNKKTRQQKKKTRKNRTLKKKKGKGKRTRRN